MDCSECNHWTIESMTYAELLEKWDTFIGCDVTPGYRERFNRESKRLNLPFDQTELTFKYCRQGKLSRFYIVRNPKNTKARKEIHNCPSFNTSSTQVSELPIPSPFWSICARESHGPTKIKGQIFYPGLCENSHYFRIPAHGNIAPKPESQGKCDVCGHSFEDGLVVTEVTRFCCNKHYLEWWKDKHPSIFEKLNLS